VNELCLIDPPLYDGVASHSHTMKYKLGLSAQFYSVVGRLVM